MLQIPRRWGVAFFAIGLFVPGLHSSAGLVDPDPATFVVVLNDAGSETSIGTVAANVIGSAGAAIPSLQLARRGPAGDAAVFRHALRGFVVSVDANEQDEIETLRKHANVAYVARDRQLELHAQTFQPNMERIRVRRSAVTGVNDVYDLDVDTDIAILDTGIDPDHADLRVHRSVSFVAGDPTDGDPHGHGTHVAGIAAAIDDSSGVYGVAPGARLWAVKVVDETGFADLSAVLAGLDYVAAHADEIDVVNMSFGGTGVGDDGNCGATSEDPLHAAVCNVVNAGVVVVVSAGNSTPYGADAARVIPASYDEVITVSAVIETDGLGPRAGQGAGTVYGPDNAFAATFSNYGWDVDLAAPGVDILSTWTGGGYAVSSGTSAAAPHVAGAAAVWIAAHGKPGNREEVLQVRRELVRLGFPRFGPDEGFAGDRETFAEPLLNVGAIQVLTHDPIEPRLTPDELAYGYLQDTVAVISVALEDDSGQPLTGIPSNGFTAFLNGRQRDVQFEELEDGAYALTLDITDLLPGDHDFTALIRSPSGFERSAGCRIVVKAGAPTILIHGFAFVWPVMSPDWFWSFNRLHAFVMDESGAPVTIDPTGFVTQFSGGGSDLVWSTPDPDLLTGVNPWITYGAYQTTVTNVDTLPAGVHHADLTVTVGMQSDSATASFTTGYPDAALSAVASTNVSVQDFTQSIAPPSLDVTVRVEDEWQTGVSGLLLSSPGGLSLEIDGQEPGVPGFVEDLLDPGYYVATGVETAHLAHGEHELRVRVTDSRGLATHSAPVGIEVIQPVAPCSGPFSSGGLPDTDGDGVRDECDNCPFASNASQRDTSPEGETGDACRSKPTLWVSSLGSDHPDFFSIQDAVDHASDGFGRIEVVILPGSGPYTESVVVDRGMMFKFVGRDLGSGPPVVQTTTPGGSAFDLRSTGEGTMSIRNLLLRGQGAAANQRGISSAPGISTRLEHLRFEALALGMDLESGRHELERVEMDASVGAGVIAANAEVALSYGEFRGVADAIRLVGPESVAGLDHVLVVGNGSAPGITLEAAPSASLHVSHATLVGCGTALRVIGGQATVAHAILWDNQIGVAGVDCGDLVWSDVQGIDCAGTNLSLDPGFVDPASGDFRLRADSPLRDHGPDPSRYTGAPCTDLDGNPRLRDHDGDTLAQIDPGVYEHEDDERTPAEVTGLRWSQQGMLEWDPVLQATEYHVYRGLLDELAYSAFGTCHDAIETTRQDAVLADDTVPPSGKGFYYQITTEDASGAESTLGVGTCAERSNFTACP